MFIVFSLFPPPCNWNSLSCSKIPTAKDFFWQYVNNYVRAPIFAVESGGSHKDWMYNTAEPLQPPVCESCFPLFVENLLWQHLCIAVQIPVCLTCVVTCGVCGMHLLAVLRQATTNTAVFCDAECTPTGPIVLFQSFRTHCCARVLAVWKVMLLFMVRLRGRMRDWHPHVVQPQLSGGPGRGKPWTENGP
jgi:hypothetical protein